MRLVPLLSAVAVAAAIAPASATASSLTRCPDDPPFNAAIYTRGQTCQHALEVISVWNAHGHTCHVQTCRITHDFSFGLRTFECTNAHHVDGAGRHYVALGCLTDDRRHDVRARDYPHGDYSPG
jgi:hypothetical protein